MKGEIIMLRNDFIKNVAERSGEPQVDVKKILEAIEDETMHLVDIEDYAPFAFGKIGGKTKDARIARNPKTGAKVEVPEKRGVVYFKASSKMKK